jgi:ubiquinone/menaquinone biosynthesis C-methylase UbiE
MSQATQTTTSHENESLKACCAAVYESDLARLLLGDSFHPGGLELTERLGALMGLSPETRVLDVASGRGTSAIHIGQHFGCQVVGIDYGRELVTEANGLAAEQGLADQVRFELGDAENLPFPDDSFDAVVCECAFCVFPDKNSAAAEFYRILRPGGRLGLSDLTREGDLPAELDSLLAWVACIADARPIPDYTGWLEGAGFSIDQVERHDDALGKMVKGARAKLLGAELLIKLGKIELTLIDEGKFVDFGQARVIASSAETAVQQGKLGYAIIVASK